MKIFFFSFIVFSLGFAGIAFAQEVETSAEAVVQAETVTTADLGVGDPGLLPTSPFYFFKEIGRGLQRALTFNAIAKAELELKIASEKAAEAKKVAEQEPGNEQGVSRALANYERAQERLRSRLERLRETSENPNVDRLLDMVAQRQIAHEKLLEGLEAKHETQQSIIADIRTRIQGTFGEIAEKDTAEKFQQRLEDAFESARGSTLKHIRSLEILDRLQESNEIPEQAKERLVEVRANIAEHASQSIEQYVQEGEEGANRLRDVLQELPGDIVKRTEVLEELRARVSDRAAEALGEARERIRERIEDLPIPTRPSPPPSSNDDSGQEPVFCTQEYAPVCGVDGKTHPNRCVAIQQNKVRVAYEGECIQGRRYESRDVNRCAIIDFVCPDGFRHFADDTGCGCESGREVDRIFLPQPVPQPTPVPPPTSVIPATRAVTIASDDSSFSPSEIRVAKGTKVAITFNVSTNNVYFGGLDFRSPKFTTPQILPGNSTTVEFTADESFEFKSYWPASNVLKATGRVIVE